MELENRYIVVQCCGSGSVVAIWVLGLLDPDPLARGTVRIRMLLSSSKNSKKTLDSYCFVTRSLKNDVNVSSKSSEKT
jgi:hypothetical protein